MLPPETEKVWRFLKEQTALSGFVLIGGTALTMRINHRRSEDLDLVYPHERLPRERLESVGHLAHEAGLNFVRNDHESAVQEFAQGGLELHDYQQDFLAEKIVKVSFFVADPALEKVLSHSSEPTARPASLAELFKSKCLVAGLRSKSRDWLDLYLLMRNHGFTVRDFAAVFREAGVEAQRDIAFSRLCSGTPQRDDEGIAGLLELPPTLEEMATFFRHLRDQYEIAAAEEAALRKQRDGVKQAGA